MSSSNISSNNSNNASGIDWKRVASPNLLEQMDDSIKIMKRAAKQEAQRKVEEEKCKAEEKAKQKAEEEKQKTEEEEKQKAKENKRRAKEKYRMQAEVKRKQKADAQEATEAFRAKIAQGGAQGVKPKPRRAVSQCVPNEGIKGWYPPCDHCRRSSDSKGCVLPPNARSLTCGQCRLAKIKCHFEVSISTMERSTSGEKRKESETLVTTIETSPRGGEKCKRMKKVVVEAASTEEIKEAMGSFSVVGPSTWLDPVTQVLDHRLGEVIMAINHNTRELVRLGSKGKARAEEPEDEEERLKKTKESEDSGDEDEEEDAQHDANIFIGLKHLELRKRKIADVIPRAGYNEFKKDSDANDMTVQQYYRETYNIHIK
ncbi:hypothetical protein SCLCIDRAFT_22984 [Scleroderma citrinum Foug A]|uniref:Uncharacterized protein n=1 Tax=Scleroderma citrinum Foug A TaxID=1036808 RepID=A0A0C3DXA5_9AGAM|nr:hypothetical protein SCLCIDRAFT_22984 [Scleroderma citrinum Foug A]